jgi:FtsP/CotA-like multicopper oxidase with cupredoxin domain
MRPSPRASLLPALLLAASLAGCGERPPGAIVGDVYLAESLGEEVNLGGLPVRLLEDGEAVDSALARLCPGSAGGAAPAQAWRERARILEGRAGRTVTTNARAQFRIDSVAPGRYRLWADTTVDGTHWSWLQPVAVRGGDTVRVNLTNANPDENPFRCRR